MNLRLFVTSYFQRWRGRREQRRVLQGPVEGDITRADWAQSLQDPTAFYLRCFRYFHQRLPAELQQHRAYFTRARRGFGEDAFHVMWFLLFQEFRPAHCLEIGVYRGQVLSLMALLQRRLGVAGGVTGISPFTPAGDAVSRYREGVDYLQDTLANFRHFGLAEPAWGKAFSTDPEAQARVRAQAWDCIYIDGNHDLEVVRADWVLCAEHTRPGGLIVLDDSGRTTSLRELPFATRGHPGPSQVAAEVERSQFAEIMQVGHNRVFQKRAG